MINKTFLSTLVTVLTVFYLVSLTGCASMSKGECHTADWYQVGFNDGNSATGSRIDAHYDACSEHGVQVDQNKYRQGYAQGLRNFCVPRNGWLRGSIGRSYSNFCAADLEQSFVSAYKAGMDYFRMQQDINLLTDKKINLEERAVAEGTGLTREDKLELLRQAEMIKNEIDGLIYDSSNLMEHARSKGWSY